MATININRPLTGSQKLNKINKDLEEREKKKKKVYGQTKDVIVSAEGKKVDYSKQTEDPLNLKNKNQQNKKIQKKTTVEDTLNKQKSIQLKQQQKQKQNYGKTGISKQVKEDYEKGYHTADSNALMQNYANRTGSYDTKDYARDVYGIGKKSTLEKAGKTAKDIITNPKKALNSIPVALADVSKGAIGTMENWWETLREWDYEINDKLQNKLGLISDEELKNRRYQMEEDKKYDFTENLWRNLGWDEQNERILNENSYLTGSNKGDQLFQTVGSQLPAVAIASYFGDTRGGAEALKNSLTSLKDKQGLDLAKAALGNVGKAALMNAPSNVEIGLRSYGAASTQALKEGATYEQARRYGLASAATEIATEWVTGGIPGVESSTGWLSNAADKLIDSSTGKIKNRYVKKLAKSLLDYGFNSAGEGFEEALSEIVDPIIKNAIYTDGEKINWDNVVESAIMGAASAGILEIPGHLSGLKNDIQAIRGRDTVINQAQQMSDFQVQQIQEAVQSGQVSPIEGQQAVQFIQQRLEQVVQQANEMYAQQTGETDDLTAERSYKLNETQQGNINTQQEQNVAQNANIETVQNESKNNKNLNNQEQTEQIQETKQEKPKGKVMSSQEISDRLGVKNKTSEVENVTKNEIKNQTEAFNLGENKEKLPINTKDKLQNFKNSLKNENITDADGFYKAVEKIIKDKDYNVIADSSIKNKDGKAVDALISNENGITIKINPKSKRAAEILLMHEVTHGIETKTISDLIVDYASKNSEFNKALESLKRAYGTEDVTSEVVADISGQLFGNQEFINNLSTKEPGLFRKIYNKIVEVANKLTGNSKQALFMRDLKNKWETAYREANIESSQIKLKDQVKYSQNGEITDNKGRELNINMQNYMEDSQATDDKGQLVTVYHTVNHPVSQFNVFNPVGTPGYRFGNDFVTYFTDSKEMSGSYADQDYVEADTKRYTKVEEIEDFINKLNEITNNRDEWELVELPENNAVDELARFDFDNRFNGRYKDNPELAYKRGLITEQEFKDVTMKSKYAIQNNENDFIRFESEDDLLRNFKNKLADKLSELRKNPLSFDGSTRNYNEQKWQYEGYVNITKPYIIDAEGRNWNEITREINKEKVKAINSINSEQQAELTKLSKLSNTLHKEYLSGDLYKDYVKYNKVYETLDNTTSENLVLLSMKDIVNPSDYVDMYNEFGEGKDPESTMTVDGKEIKFKNFAADWCSLEKSQSKFGKPWSYFMSKAIKNYGNELRSVGVQELYEISEFGFSDWIKDDVLGRDMTTNDVVKKVLQMNKDGDDYDGVIIKNTTDYGGYSENDDPHDLYITFSPEQFKAWNNPDPTNDPDIRYSEKAKKWREFVEKNFKNEGTTTRLDEKINNENVTEKEKTSVDYTQEQLDALLNKISEAKEKELKAQMSKKDSKNFDTTKEILKDFKSAKDGEFNNKKLRKYVKTSNDATGMQKSIEQADLDKITYSVKENKTTYEEARNNIKDLSYDERKTRSKNKLNSRDRVTATDIVETQMTMLEAAKKGDIQTYLDLQQDVAIMATEYGQTIQALSMIQKMSPEGQIETLMKIINRKQKLGNKTWKNVELNPNLVKKVLDSYDDETHTTYNQELMEQAVDELKQDLANQMKVSWSEKANEWRYLSMLGNPKTHIRNMIGNVAMSLVKLGKDVTSAAGQDVASKLGLIDKTSKTTTLKFASKDVRNLAKQSFEEMTALEGKNNKYNESSSIEQQRKIFKSKVAEGARKLNLDWLEKEDKVFKNLNFRRSFSKYLTAQGITTQADIKANPQIVADAKVFAMNEAKIATFQQQNKAAKWIRDLDKLGPVAEVVRGSIIPFTTVPMNIAETGLEYAPTGLLKTIADTKKAPKGQKGVVFIDGISKQIVGGSLAILGYALAKSGKLKADAGDDNEDKFLKDIGAKMDYSIKLGDTSYDLSWLSPSAMPFFVGAAFYEQLEKGQGIDGNFLTEALASTLDPLSEMSVISSLTEIFDSYEKNKAKRIANAGEKALQNYITQYIPTAFSQFARTLDDKKRSTYADKNSPWTFGQETLRKVAYKIPGARNLLPEQKDYLGRTKEENKNIALRALESFVSPMNYKKDTSNEVTKELVRLYDETGGSGLIPTKPDQYIKYKNEKYEMTQKEYNDFKKDYGENAFTEVNKALKDKDYQNLSDSQKAAVIKNIMGYSKYKAKYDYFEDRDIDYYNQTYDTARKSEENGHAIYDYYISKKTNNKSATSNTKGSTNRYEEVAKKGIDAKTFDDFKNFVNNARGDSRRGGKTKKQKVQEYIQSLNLTAKQKQDLYNDYLNNSGYISYYK